MWLAKFSSDIECSTFISFEHSGGERVFDCVLKLQRLQDLVRPSIISSSIFSTNIQRCTKYVYRNVCEIQSRKITWNCIVCLGRLSHHQVKSIFSTDTWRCTKYVYRNVCEIQSRKITWNCITCLRRLSHHQVKSIFPTNNQRCTKYIYRNVCEIQSRKIIQNCINFVNYKHIAYFKTHILETRSIELL